MLWITGAKGLLGSVLRERCEGCVASGREVDVADQGAVEAFLQKNQGIRWIVNCAAFTNVDAAEERREEAYRANVMGPVVLGEAALKVAARLIHISTDYVFDGKVGHPLREEDETAPCNYYGWTKREGEKRALELFACVIRTSWVFGIGGMNLVSKLLPILQVEKEFRVGFDQWSRFTYAPDLAEAILQMLDAKGLYQFANRGVGSKYDFAVAMREEALKLGFPIVTESIVPVASEVFPSPCKRPTYSAFDTTKIEKLVKIRHWREALKDFLCAQLPVCS